MENKCSGQITTIKQLITNNPPNTQYKTQKHNKIKR